jgi:hypothetical protein
MQFLQTFEGDMYFKVSMRNNQAIQDSCGCYRFVESYRNEYNRICHRTLLNIGFIALEVKTRLAVIQRTLTDLADGKPSIFEEKNQITNHYLSKWWQELIDKRR